MLRVNVLGGLYLTDDGHAVRGPAAPPRGLALLALLAMAGDQGVSRERIVALLWPDADEEHGRTELAQVLESLRRDLGAEQALTGLDHPRLDLSLVRTDVGEFLRALDSGDLEHAAACYAGPFLQGFFLEGASAFGRWVDEQRRALALEYRDVLDRLAERHAQESGGGGNRAEAAQGEIVAAPPDGEEPPPRDRPVMSAPSAAAISAMTGRPVPPPSVDELAHTTGWATVQAAPRTSIRAALPAHELSRISRWALGAAALAVLLLGGHLITRSWSKKVGGAATAPGRVVAIGRIAHYAKDGPGPMGLPLADMLATNLARASGLRVVSHVRMLELMRQLGGPGDSTDVGSAARRAGATELVDGSLYDVAPGILRLDLRRVDLASGGVIEAYTVQGGDLFALADSGTSRLAGELGGSRPAGSLAEVTTRSLAAYRLYESGLRDFYRGERPQAERLFSQALGEDSAFAMAAFYHALSNTGGSRAEFFRRLNRAIALADGASDRERLLIRATWAFANSSPALRAIADTLTVRYPAELEGHLWAGQAAILAGEFGKARAPLRRVIREDSLGLAGRSQRCLACEAYAALVTSFLEADSLEAAVAAAREWTRVQPGEGRPRRLLAAALAQSGRFEEASAALTVADSLDPGAVDGWRTLAAVYLWADRLNDAAELARVQARAGHPSERAEGYWVLAIAYRHQGRMREALEAAREYRRSVVEPVPAGSAPSTALLEGQVLLEQGRFPAAAALFDSIGRGSTPGGDSAAHARLRVWTWAHVATALASLGDTVRLVRLGDSAEMLGRLSALGRDQRLHYYVRGLLARSRGNHEEAVNAFRSAIVSPNMGYTRVNYALAGELLVLGRPGEAISVLQSALRGQFEGSNLYLTHTDAAERLAEAFEAAGERDSAAAYYGRVVRDWENADPMFTPRLFAARGKALRMLEKR